MSKYTIYSDGAYSHKYDIGAIGFIILNSNNEIVCKFGKPYKHTTNQRMEQLAVIQALNSIKVASNIIVYTDSMYIVGTYNNNWKRKKNNDLWCKLDNAISKHINVVFKHIKGHAREENYNNVADRIATERIHACCFGRNG